ncbi:MAG: RHS repeat-associated core domain-containing protein [Verrucomicrobiota bacterium]|nr:RHS repeat-associated core domain-containing protein [Verrucomicrobiota bacterium]
MFNLDTAVVKAEADPGGEWEFVTVKRPSGAEVVFSLKGTTPGRSIYKDKSYFIEKVGADYRLTFPASGNIAHVFPGVAKISKLYRRDAPGAELAVPPADMAVTKDGNEIRSVQSAQGIAVPTYSDGLIVSVDYKDAGEILLRQLTLGAGATSRVFRVTDAYSNLVEETRVILNTNNNVTEIWYGCASNGTFSVAKKSIHQESVYVTDVTNTWLALTETAVLENGESNVTRALDQYFPWGRDIAQVIRGFGASVAQTNFYWYHTDPAATNEYGHLRLVENPAGSWIRYDQYDNQHRRKVVVTPFANAGPTAAANECRVTRCYYAGDAILTDSLNFPSDQTCANDDRVRLVVEEALGAEISRTCYAYFAGSNITKRCVGAGAAYDAASSLATVNFFNTSGPYEGQVSRIEHADGTISALSYATNGATMTVTTETGAGSAFVTNGTRAVATRAAIGGIVREQSVDIVSGIVLRGVINTFDALGRMLTSSNELSGALTEYSYACCDMPEAIRDAEGMSTIRTYDELKQLFCESCGEVSTYYTYNVSGQVTETRRSASGQPDIVVNSVFDALGRLIATTNELGYVTRYGYWTNDSGESLGSVTNADESVRMETRYRDGSLKSVSGTAAYPAFSARGVENGEQYSIEYRGSDTNASEWVKTYTDMLGRTARTVHPGGYTNAFFYDSRGRLARTSDGFTTSLTVYNARGEAFRSAVDMNADNELDLAGPDRVSETQSSYGSFGGKNARTTLSLAYPTNGSSATLTLAARHSSVDGLESWSIALGRTNHTQLAYDRAGTSRTETVTYPDNTQTVTAYTNGLRTAVTRKDAVGGTTAVSSFSYDTFRRLSIASEPAANGETRTTSYQYNPAGQVTNETVTAGALSQTTGTEFDSMGRRVKTILPDGGEVFYSFNSLGEMTNQYGARAYPVSFTYTDQGRLATLSTYRNGMTGAADVTTWQYDTNRGWMSAKVYADNSINAYEYLGNGALSKRAWARGIETLYSRDAGGSLTNLNYSDATPDVTFTLDRLARPVEIADGIGAWTNVYAEDGSLLSGSLPQMSGAALEYGRDALGRMTNLSLTGAGAPSPRLLTAYSFDNAGRLSTVSDGMNTATYTYGPDGATWTNLSFGAAMKTRRSFDGLNRLSSISSVPSAGSAVSFSYSCNQANQRVTNTLADGSQWRYTYNERGEVISGKKYFSDGTPVGGAQYGYEFDTIGNRKSSVAGIGDPGSSYTANNLNQYTQRTVPGRILVDGTSTPNAVVSARLSSNDIARLASRHGDYFWLNLAATNTSSAVFATNLQVIAYLTQTTNSLVKTETRSAMLPQTPETFVHDLDGNLLSDGLWTNMWDAENRLIAVESLPAVPDALKKRLEFRYDHRSRRTEKKSLSGYSDGTYSTTNIASFVWDGWNIVAELGTGYTNHMTWGQDLSGTVQGACGIGGLLFVTLGTSGTYCVTYNGNGDMMALVDAGSGVVAGALEYGPFAEPLKVTGVAQGCPIRFSTQYRDEETGDYAYVFRIYRPGIGRWLSRDPIGERGGRNLYGFVGNQPLSRHDKLGLSWWNCCDECSPLGKKRLTGIKTFLKPGTKGNISPEVGEIGEDLLGSLQTLGLIQAVGDLASAQKLAEFLLSLADSAIDDGRAGGFEGAALAGIDAIRRNLLLLEGAVVWVRLDWDECKDCRCILVFVKYKDWVADHKWKQCQRGGTHVSGGFDLGVLGELGTGVGGCIRDAVGEFVNGNF